MKDIKERLILTTEEMMRVSSFGLYGAPIPLVHVEKICQVQLNKILSDPDILVRADDQSLPQPTKLPFYLDPTVPMVSQAGIGIQKTQLMVYERAQQDMLKVSYVKVLPKEQGK